MASQEVIFEEADASHAQALIDFMNQVAGESDYLVMDDAGFQVSLEEMQGLLTDSLASPDRLCLLALLGDRIIGVINVRNQTSYPISHIGDIFMAVAKDYWGNGIGRILLEEVVFWAQEMGLLKRLELTVQVRNERAVRLYQSCEFEIEGTQRRGARTDEGEWLDLYYMGRLID